MKHPFSDKTRHIAQFNISIEKYSLDDPRMALFVSKLEEVNRQAEQCEGFVWRLHDVSGNATAIRIYDDKRIIFNFSVWKNIESIQDFTYSGVHREVLVRRRDWFEKQDTPSMVLWNVKLGFTPTIDEAKKRLEHLREHGPSSYAFNFRTH